MSSKRCHRGGSELELQKWRGFGYRGCISIYLGAKNLSSANEPERGNYKRRNGIIGITANFHSTKTKTAMQILPNVIIDITIGLFQSK